MGAQTSFMPLRPPGRLIQTWLGGFNLYFLISIYVLHLLHKTNSLSTNAAEWKVRFVWNVEKSIREYCTAAKEYCNHDKNVRSCMVSKHRASPSHPSQGEREIPNWKRGLPLRAEMLGKKESPSCGVSGGARRNKALREATSPRWEGCRKTITWACVGAHQAWVLQFKILQMCRGGGGNSDSVILAFPPFLPVSFQSAWGSLFHSSDITRGFHSASTLCLPLAHNPTHIWKWEEGNPRWWLKASAAKGNSLHICFLCVCMHVCVCYECIEGYFTSSS